MEKQADVEILIVDVDLGTRESIRVILHNHGFRKLYLGETLADIRSAIKESPIDLLICECQLSDGELSPFVRELRHHEIGDNPFLPIIALSAVPTPELVADIVGAGVDDLLPKPISSGHLLKRLQALIKRRKPFVVTSEYIGPDRRTEANRESKIPQIVVPNILKEKITGVIDGGGFGNSIAAAVAEINLQKLERYAVQIGVLVSLILMAYENKKIGQKLYQMVDRLHYVVSDTSRRLVGTKYDPVSELCRSLISVTEDIQTMKEDPRDKDLKLLPPLSQAIQKAFEVDEDVADMARKISASVSEGSERESF